MKKKSKLNNYFKSTAIVASAIIIAFIIGCTCIHVNGTETVLSSLLRDLGIDSEEKETSTNATISFDLSNATDEVVVGVSNENDESVKKSSLIQYKSDDYNFKYKATWKLIPQIDETKVGSDSIYLGALGLEIPSTTNSEYSSTIYVKTIKENTTITEYKEKIQKENTTSPSEYYIEKSTSKVNFKNQSGYQITSETTDGEDLYIKKDIFAVSGGEVYRITFFGTEKEYNNLSDDIDEFISNFEI